MRKNDQTKVETAAEIYSRIKTKTMVAVTASFFWFNAVGFCKHLYKGLKRSYKVYFNLIGSIPLRRNAPVFNWI